METQPVNSQAGPKPYSNPYLAGVLLGLVLLGSFVILGAGLGASSGIARIGDSLSMCIAPAHTLGTEYFGKWGAKPLNYYLVFMFAGTVIGALASALLARRARLQVERGAAVSVGRRLAYALVGGLLVGTFIGALFSALLASRARIQVERGARSSRGRRLAYALVGGVLVGFASRLAQGCTSGQALSGGALLLSGSFVFLICLFASGYATAGLVRRQWHD